LRKLLIDTVTNSISDISFLVVVGGCTVVVYPGIIALI
jgi:hypothetical protein